MLYHGTTIHGAQRIRDEAGARVTGRPEPLTYYHDRGPMAEAVAAIRSKKGKLDRVMVVGLGSGSLACQAKPGEQWTHFRNRPGRGPHRAGPVEIPLSCTNARPVARSCWAMRGLRSRT